jgi:hypothetical protein
MNELEVIEQHCKTSKNGWTAEKALYKLEKLNKAC